MKTASIIIIGNEILSGRTKDTNSNYLAKILVKKVKPNFKVLGPKFGKDLNSVIALIKDLKSSQIQELEELQN